MGLNGFIFRKMNENENIKMKKKSFLKIGWIGCAIQQATSKRLPGLFFRFNILIFIYFFKYKTIETQARAFLPLNIAAVGSVQDRGQLECRNVCSAVQNQYANLQVQKNVYSVRVGRLKKIWVDLIFQYPELLFTSSCLLASAISSCSFFVSSSFSSTSVLTLF